VGVRQVLTDLRAVGDVKSAAALDAAAVGITATVPSWQLKQASDGPVGVGDGTAFIWEIGTVLVLYMIQGPTEVV
jgi:hypothetical protein